MVEISNSETGFCRAWLERHRRTGLVLDKGALPLQLCSLEQKRQQHPQGLLTTKPATALRPKRSQFSS
jgi:hypothetical protein